ncbi:ATP-grasp domain-containing protein [Eggerthella guodeyinii]|uniref:ATP-grasp domain-containing protein n=1 Tax=Eggerthella guodeyinii TaxID=2690837 RepID=A0A6L7J0V1_9ACTN|nr:ATP-grasp domain-containing protein [Eggerthella guodeyinii]QOS67606.1 ATP-grasp domain-containing protein [Eggerthella guodeyinii]
MVDAFQGGSVVVLCGIAAHTEFIRCLKRRGFSTILVDYLEHPPAADAADLHIQESAFDLETVIRIARQHHAKFIAAPCIDQVNIIACKASEALGLSCLYSSEIALKVTDKYEMKKIMHRVGIPTARFARAREKGSLERDVGGFRYPLIVKPIDGFASAGVSKIDAPCELAQAFDCALAASSRGEVIAEEFLSGYELSVYAFISNGRARVVMGADRYTYISDAGIRCYATLAPSMIASRQIERIEGMVQDIADELAIRDSPFFIQFFHDGDSLWATEFAGRMGGGFSYFTTLRNTGFDLMNATIDAYLGIPPNVTVASSRNVSLIEILYSDYGVFDRLDGVKELIDEGVVDEFFLYKNSGDEITPEKPARARIATAVINGNDMEDVLKKAEVMMGRLEAYDVHGKEILLKDVYLKRSNAFCGTGNISHVAKA